MGFDLEQLRSDTPGCSGVIHFENAGSSLMPIPVIETVRDHFDLEIRYGGYRSKDERAEQFEEIYSLIAQMIGASSHEIALAENATRAWTSIFYSLEFSAGDIILTSEVEYASNYIAMLQIAKRYGVEIQVIPSNTVGEVDVAALEEMISDRVKLIAITHTPTNGGLVNPAEEIGRVANKYNVLYLLDACQTVGQYPIDVRRIGCDFLTATGRKYLRAPRGTGFLYIKESLIEKIEPCILDLYSASWTSKDEFSIRSDARRFETWEKNYCDFLGLGAAVKYAMSLGLQPIWERVTMLADQLRTELSQIAEVTCRDIGSTKCGIVTFDAERMSSKEICSELRKSDIHCSESSPFGTRIDMEKRGLPSVVRASVHYFNSEEEIVQFCTSLRALLK